MKNLFSAIARFYPKVAKTVYEDRARITQVTSIDDGHGGWGDSQSIIARDIPCVFVPFSEKQKEQNFAGGIHGVAEGIIYLPGQHERQFLDVPNKARITIAARGVEPERVFEVLSVKPYVGILTEAVVAFYAE